MVILCSARVSALVIVPTDSTYEGIGKITDLSDSERRQIVGAPLVGASLTKMLHYYMNGERLFLRLSRHTTSAKRNSGRNVKANFHTYEYVIFPRFRNLAFL